jgi:hypothetical protein
VNPGQEFEAEWATGHGESPNSGSHYFTVVKAQDEEEKRGEREVVGRAAALCSCHSPCVLSARRHVLLTPPSF